MPNDDPTFPPTLTASVALVVASLAAVGVSGDFITRMVRSHADRLVELLVPILILFALAGAVSLLVGSAHTFVKLAGTLAIFILCFALVQIVNLGAGSVASREQPRLILSASAGTDASTTVTAEASGAGLSIKDDMLIQVLGIRHLPDPVLGAAGVCQRNVLGISHDDLLKPVNYDGLDVELLVWQRPGPDTKGNVAATVKVDIPTGTFEGLCAYGVLSRQGTGKLEGFDIKATAAYLRLPLAAEAPVADLPTSVPLDPCGQPVGELCSGPRG